MDDPKPTNPNRRTFLKQSSLGASYLALHPLGQVPSSKERPFASAQGSPSTASSNRYLAPDRELDLSPAQWLWYPSERVLQNTMVLFRRTLNLTRKPSTAHGWILGDSRYLLSVNGQRVQWGPAPSDPRWSEADPIDLTAVLQTGSNALCAQVLYFGQGDGTWPIGKAGFIFYLALTYDDGSTETIVSDQQWMCHLARSWKPGQYKRWYLRAFQEEFDARLYPNGWTAVDFNPDDDWLPAMDLRGPSNEPSICTQGKDYLYDSEGDQSVAQLRRRSVPMLQEVQVPVAALRESVRVKWIRPAEEYFESLTPNAFSIERDIPVEQGEPGSWRFDAQASHGTALTFEFEEQIVGWPYFTITAPAGTVIELMVQEAHKVGGPALLNTRFHSWTRFICREGRNTFETFDFESLRWLQLHIRDTAGPITVEAVGVRRRLYPWPNEPAFSCSDGTIQRVWEAAVNTLHNGAQDTIVDCMGRERQQYSGDIGHTLHAIFFAFGETRQPARFVDTFSQGLTNTGYYLDCWPAYDRLARLPEREMQLTRWGPLLDHGVGHAFDAYYYYLYTGDLAALAEVYPRLLRFFEYLQSLRTADALLPVENLGTPAVWIDHDAYEQQRHKQCVFNLYASAMLLHALHPLCKAHGDEASASSVQAAGLNLLQTTLDHFWSPRHNTFVANLPWLEEEATPRYCDRSLALSLMYEMQPQGSTNSEALRLLVETPEAMGFSYPANAGWRLWGLAAGRRVDVILDELRTRWGRMRSIHENNTLSEHWEPQYDGTSQWSHQPVVPLYVLYMSLLGIKPLAPGFTTYEIQPQLGDLTQLSCTAYTVKGPIQVDAEGPLGARRLTLTLPPEGTGLLVLDARETVSLTEIEEGASPGLKRYVLPAGDTVTLHLRYT